VSDGTTYNTFNIRFNEYNKSEYQWGDYIMEDSRVIIAVEKGSAEETALQAILEAALGTVVADNDCITTTSTTTTIWPTTTTTSTLIP
jgi:hypothetical protein